MPDSERQDGERLLVLVTGSGRSGTSSLSGALSALGFHVPLPMVQANEANPKGFFETLWVVEFHARLLRQALVRSSDGTPAAPERVAAVLADGSAQRELTEWLSQQDQPALLIKDNQACWFLDLWRAAAGDCGRDLRLLTSLRHPAEVVGSRDLVWGQGRELAERRSRETTNVAAWLNVALTTELAGRDIRRAFVRYGDLLDDWRGILARVRDLLGLDLDLPGRGAEHELDTWLDAGLRRSQLGWDDIAVPDGLRALADDAWGALGALVADPRAEDAVARLDGVREEYAAMYAEAFALARDESRHLQKAAARRSAAKLRARTRRLRDRLRAQQTLVDRQHAEAAGNLAGPAAVARRVARLWRGRG